MAQIKVLFVCMGNICRSPSAEGVFEHQVKAAGLSSKIMIDSAGTLDFHQGKGADARALKAATNRGYDISAHRSRPVTEQDFENFDYIIAMDDKNYEDMLSVSSLASQKVTLMMNYAEELPQTVVPDPYYGGNKGFERVLDLLEVACNGLLDEIRTTHSL